MALFSEIYASRAFMAMPKIESVLVTRSSPIMIDECSFDSRFSVYFVYAI